jgi:hypothetical protein
VNSCSTKWLNMWRCASVESALSSSYFTGSSKHLVICTFSILNVFLTAHSPNRKTGYRLMVERWRNNNTDCCTGAMTRLRFQSTKMVKLRFGWVTVVGMIKKVTFHYLPLRFPPPTHFFSLLFFCFVLFSFISFFYFFNNFF